MSIGTDLDMSSCYTAFQHLPLKLLQAVSDEELFQWTPRDLILEK